MTVGGRSDQVTAIYEYEGTCTAEVNKFEEYYTKVDIRFI